MDGWMDELMDKWIDGQMDRWISIGCDREDKTSQRPFEPKYNWKVDQGTINGKIWKWNQMEKQKETEIE